MSQPLFLLTVPFYVVVDGKKSIRELVLRISASTTNGDPSFTCGDVNHEERSEVIPKLKSNGTTAQAPHPSEDGFGPNMDVQIVWQAVNRTGITLTLTT